MPIVSDFLKGTVDESLTKLVQPTGLVPAAILVLLNLGFLYPAATADEVPVVKAFADLDEQWKVVVVAALVLAIGYLLLHAANWIIAVLAGQTWRASALNWLLRRWQRRERKQLQVRVDDPARTNAEVRWQLATRFPSLDHAVRTQPTRLGNTLVATQHILFLRHGIDITALWSQMESAESAKDAPAITAVKDAKSTLDLLANLVFVLAIFAVEAVVYFGYRERWNSVLISFLVLPLAYVTYRVADTAARSWGNAVEVTLDLHRDKLKDELGLRKTKDASDEHQLWRKASKFYLPGGDEPAGDLFERSTPTAEIIAAPSIDVQKIAAAFVDEVAAKTIVTGGTSFDLRSIDYLFIVSRKAEVEKWAEADFFVEDPRIEIVAAPPTVHEGAIKAEARIHPSEQGSRLRWHVSGLRQGASLALGYRLPLWTLMVTHQAADAEVRREGDTYRLFIPGGGGTTVGLEFAHHSRPTDRPTVKLGTSRIELLPEDGRLKSVPIHLPHENKAIRITLPKEQSNGA